MCIQETKCIDDNNFIDIDGYDYVYNSCSVKKSYSGTCIYFKSEYMDDITYTDSFGDKNGRKQFNDEGRFLYLRYKNIDIINTYSPNSNGWGRVGVTTYIPYFNKSAVRGLNWRLAYDIELLRFTKKVMKKGEEKFDKKYEIYVCGDFNVCRKPRDYWKGIDNAYYPSLCKEEKESFEKFIDLGLLETIKKHKFTYYSFRGGSKDKGRGFRLDYILSNNKNFITKVIDYGTSDHLLLDGNYVRE